MGIRHSGVFILMDFQELKTKIIEKDLNNFYIFVGTEMEIQRIYLKQIGVELNRPIVREDSVLNVLPQCTSKSLLGNSSKIYVVMEDKDIMKDEKNYANLITDIGNNILILQYSKVDSRLKFFKHFKDSIVEFVKLQPRVLNAYIKRVCPLSEKGLAELSNKISGSYDLALLESQKINLYAQNQNISVDSAFEILSRTGVIYQPEEVSVFEFTTAVLAHDVNNSFR